MRKYLLALALVLVLMLVSCGAPMTPSTVTPAAEENGITLKTQFPVYAPDVPFIQFSIINNSGETAEFGTEWSIERLEGDMWYSVPFKPDTAWTMPLYMLLDGGTAAHTAHLSILDHKFKEGTYRIVKEINDTPYTAEFSIGDSPVGGDSPYGFEPLDALPADYTAEMAAEDGVILLDENADFSRFFHEMSIGMNTQLRYAEHDTPKSVYLTNLTVESHLGQKRIRYTKGVTDAESDAMYFGYIITDGEQIALSAYPTWQEKDYTRVLLHGLSGNAAFISALEAASEPVDTPYPMPEPASAFWSSDGTQLLTLFPNAENPLEFGLSQLYEGGGSAGSMCEIDTPGMKAIRGALWTGENTVMLICDVEDNSLSGMTGYVFYDTEQYTVTSYTQSLYDPINDHGTFLIPE